MPACQRGQNHGGKETADPHTHTHGHLLCLTLDTLSHTCSCITPHLRDVGRVWTCCKHEVRAGVWCWHRWGPPLLSLLICCRSESCTVKTQLSQWRVTSAAVSTIRDTNLQIYIVWNHTQAFLWQWLWNTGAWGKLSQCMLVTTPRSKRSNTENFLILSFRLNFDIFLGPTLY